MKREKVLIIKAGYSETLDPEVSAVTSYGDVMRTTVLLHAFEEARVTWLVDRKALPILKDIARIDRVLLIDPLTLERLRDERFDTVINLEKGPGLCALADGIHAARKYGFRFDERSGAAEAHEGTETALSLCTRPDRKRRNGRCAQQLLYEMIGRHWSGEPYVFGYKPRSRVRYDIGFNYEVGGKWPSKAWPLSHWKQLERLLGEGVSVSWQQGLDNMEDYFEWIHQCRMLVTSDSFGLHLALSMKKRVVSLFGPTNPHEVCHYGLGETVVPGTDCPHIPCHRPRCVHPRPCMDRLDPETVHETILRVFREAGRVQAA